ncbi:MAG: DJ-1/PfpI family protein [Pseudonocardia sp.]
MQVAIALFPQLTALDAIGPYEVLQRVPSIDVTFVAQGRGEVRTENGFLGLIADATFDELPSPEVVVVPGGVGTRELLAGGPLLDWVRAAAGPLTGLTATTHWGAMDILGELGAEPVTQRVVEHLPERVITAAGVSAGIDMAIRLLELLVDDVAAQAAQVLIEYDPQPPFDAGHPSKVGPEVMERIAEYQLTRS